MISHCDTAECNVDLAIGSKCHHFRTASVGQVQKSVRQWLEGFRVWICGVVNEKPHVGAIGAYKEREGLVAEGYVGEMTPLLSSRTKDDIAELTRDVWGIATTALKLDGVGSDFKCVRDA